MMDDYSTRGQRLFLPVFLTLLFLTSIAIAIGITAKCWPRKAHWDPFRGLICYGEAP